MIATTNASTLLLIGESRLGGADRALILSASDSVLALEAARRVNRADVYDAGYSALRRVYRRAETLRVDNLTVHDDIFPPPTGEYDVALMDVPKGRDFARAQMWAALRALRPGGRLYVAGPTNGGTKSVINDAAGLFGRCVTLKIKSRHRIGVAIRPETPPLYPWGDDPSAIQQRLFDTPGGQITIATMPGIFSWEHLDDGTAFLLAQLSIQAGQRVLDVGCGNGIIGVFAAPTAGQMVMVDDNLLAVACARETVRLNGLANATVQPGDVYDGLEGQQFDLIVSNPPFHQAFDVDTDMAHRLIGGARQMLRPGGRLVIVANAFLKYEQVMASHLTRSSVLARDNRFMVIEGQV
jgi:16S rRNA (guanine1207-N2)-methyltransferase